MLPYSIVIVNTMLCYSKVAYYLEDAIEIDFVTKESIIEAKYNRDIEKKKKFV